MTFNEVDTRRIYIDYYMAFFIRTVGSMDDI
jgi:hypothetical protein